jgi:nucleotide-binding universal stress UspA family protein
MLPKPIVVGVDASPESRLALALAWKIAEAAHADLVPVHAVPDLWLASGLGDTPVVLPEVQDALTQASRKQIEAMIDEVVPRSGARRLEVRTGPAAFAIADVARQLRAELVVLGGRQHGALARGLGRSTAHYLVRTLDVPVLVVGHSLGPLTRVLVAVDLSTAAIPAIRAAERFAKLLGARLRIVHVVEPLRLMYLPIDVLDQVGFEQHSRDAFERLTAPLATLVREDQVVRTGLPVETIVEEATAWQADLLVVGSHGKGWVDRLLVGSTTERLLNVLPASMMVIPTAVAAKNAKQGRPARPRKQSRPRAHKARARRK